MHIINKFTTKLAALNNSIKKKHRDFKKKFDEFSLGGQNFLTSKVIDLTKLTLIAN